MRVCDYQVRCCMQCVCTAGCVHVCVRNGRAAAAEVGGQCDAAMLVGVSGRGTCGQQGS